MVNILFVGTGPVSYYVFPRIVECHISEIKKQLPKLVFSYVLENNLIYEDESRGGLLNLYIEDLPEKYQKMLFKDIILHDLDKYRKKICDKVKEYFPDATKISYTSVDPYIFSPKICELEKEVIKNDKIASKKYGITFSFNGHHKCEFQSYIVDCDKKYDIVWFLGCCNPHYVIDISKKYISNFKNIIKTNGYIFHMDPANDSCKLDFIGLEHRIRNMDNNGCFDESSDDDNSNDGDDVLEKTMWRIKYLTSKLVKVETGVYQFDV